jgi:hypothetical protein
VKVRPSTDGRYWFNPDAYVNPPDYSFGNVPRFDSKARGPGALNFNMAIFKTTHVSERTTLEIRVEAYNALNKVNLQQPNTAFTAGPAADPANPTAEGGGNTNPNFGKVLASQAARVVQLGAKLRF